MRYALLADLYAALESTPKRLHKTWILSQALKACAEDELARMIYLVQGTVFPPWSSQKVGVAERLVIKALQVSYGETPERIESQWRQTGDLGDVASGLAGKRKQATLFSAELTVKKVFENIEKVSTMEGEGMVDRKVQLMAELLTSASPAEARYIVRTLLNQLRAGLGESTLRDAVAWAFVINNVPYDLEVQELGFSDEEREAYMAVITRLQQAMDLSCDIAVVVALVKKKGMDGLGQISFEPGRPVKVMLFQKAKGLREAFEALGVPLSVEYKYDGFRMQIHRTQGTIKIFTRRLEEVTLQFPEVAEHFRQLIPSTSYILDGEACGFDPASRRYLPFQEISQRIKRKHGIVGMAGRNPVEVRVFDAVFLNGESLLEKPYRERRRRIESLVPSKEGLLAPARAIQTSNIDEAQSLYESALAAGMEGVMVKRLDAPYQPGSRVGFGVKVKPVMDTLDLAIVAAEWGEGKRAGWLTSFTLACRGHDGAWLEVGNVGTGFKEKQEEGTTFADMTDLVKPWILREVGRQVVVKPRVVLEVKFEEIQKSPTYSSGFALRFPRLVQVREDKPIEEASSIDEVQGLFGQQK